MACTYIASETSCRYKYWCWPMTEIRAGTRSTSTVRGGEGLGQLVSANRKVCGEKPQSKICEGSMLAVLAIGFLSGESHGGPLWVSQVYEEVLSDDSWGCSKCPQGLLSSSSGKVLGSSSIQAIGYLCHFRHVANTVGPHVYFLFPAVSVLLVSGRVGTKADTLFRALKSWGN